jgi:D-3-phosphoglycerate dehydrogenase
MPNRLFRVGFSADFLDENRQPVFPDIGLSLLDAQPGVESVFLPDYHPEYLPAQLDGFDVVISLKPRVTEASLLGVERLCAIGRCGVGYDNVDLGACTDRDIAVYITPAGVMRPMAESIVLLVLALSHNLVVKDRLVREGRWLESTRPLGREPRGRTIGVIGLGNIGREVVRLLSGFDIGRFLAFDPFLTPEQLRTVKVESASLDNLLRLSDYVLINCPLNNSTYHMVGERELRLMKREAVLVNTARGPIVDENALIRALQEGWIRAAALDVFEKEPLDTSSPLLRLENVILTSHSVGWTEELFRDMGRLDCEGALAVMRGQPPMNVVNGEVLDRPGFRRKLELYRERGSQ